MSMRKDNARFQISDFKWRTIALVCAVAMAGWWAENTESGIRIQDSGKDAGKMPAVQTARHDTQILRFASLGSPGEMQILRFASLAFARDKQNDNQKGQDQQIPTIKKEVRLVLVEATVKDRGGKAMKVLKQEDFLLFEDGKPQEIAHFSQDQLPLAVAMVVDLSGSIQPFLRPLRYASMSALKALKQEDEVALLTFTENVERRVDLTHDKLAVSDQIEFFEAGGGTNINDALYQAAVYLREQAPAARRVIVLVSDNVPTVGGESPERVLTEALEADAAIYGLKVPGHNPIGSKALSVGRGFVNVTKMCEETGGEIFEVEKEGSLFLAFAALIERLKTRYTLGFYPGNKPTDRQLRKLEVKLQSSFGVKGHDYSVVAKRGYFPATK